MELALAADVLGGSAVTATDATTRVAAVAVDHDPIPFARAEICEEAQRRAVEVMQSGWITTGPECFAFEDELAERLGARHAIAVSSCTAAIELALRAYGLPSGAKVLTPTLTFAGAVHAIVHAGMQPVLVDADEETLTMNPEAVAAAAIDGADAIVVQHMAGFPSRVRELAEAAGLAEDRLVEDAAHGLGSEAGGVPVGATSRAACFSFYATKNLPIGEGGAITTYDGDLAARVRALRLHGMSDDAWQRYRPGGSWRYTITEDGLKANFTDVQAAIGRAQLPHFDGWQRRRAELAAAYDSALADVPGILLPARPTHGRHAWHLYIVRVTPEFGVDRDALAESLSARNIGTSVHFIPVHHQPYFRRLLGQEHCSRLEVADKVFPTLLSLPLHPGMTTCDVHRVVSAVLDVHKAQRHAASLNRRGDS